MRKQSLFVQESFGQNVLGKITGKNKWRVRLIAPGKGSSGYYTEEVLSRDGARAWPVGTLSHVDHQTFWEKEERPEKSLKTVAGVIASEPVYEESGPDGPGLYADMEFMDQWAPFVEQLHEHIGVSISAKGLASDTEEIDGMPVVEMLLPYPTNSVDLVTAAGAGGKFSHVIEGFRDILMEATEEERKEPGMTPEDIEKIGKALAEALVPSLVEALTPEPVEDVEEAEVDISAVSEALITAKLPEVARKRVYKAVEAGTELDEAIKEQTDFIEAIKSDVELEEGVLHGAKTENPEQFNVGVWK